MLNRPKVTPNDLSAFWMPFTANRQYKQTPRMFVGSKDMHYTTTDGLPHRRFDGAADEDGGDELAADGLSVDL